MVELSQRHTVALHHRIIAQSYGGRIVPSSLLHRVNGTMVSVSHVYHRDLGAVIWSHRIIARSHGRAIAVTVDLSLGTFLDYSVQVLIQ
jgi:hypothetical protein